MTTKPLFLTVAGPIASVSLPVQALTIPLPNGDFGSTKLTHAVSNTFADEASLDNGWYARDADDGVRIAPAEFDWSSGATPALGGSPGEMTLISIDNTHTRFGQFFTKPAGLTGTGWSFQLDVGGNAVNPGFTKLEIWGGNLAETPTGVAFNIGTEAPPDGTLVTSGWTTLLTLDGVFGAGIDQEFPVAADLSAFDVMVIRVRTTRANNQVGTTFDNFEFVNDSIADSALGFDVASSGNDLVFTWDSQEGKVYDLLSSADPEADGDPGTWAVVAGQEDIVAIPPSNMLTIQRPVDVARFYVIREENAPPPPPVFFDDFESDMGWQTGVGGSHAGNTTWELGPPDTNFVDGPDSGANGSATCYGTDLDNNYEAGTEIWLRSPPINLTEATGATLSFWHIFDVNGNGDEIGVVRVLRSSDNGVLAEVETFGDDPFEFFLDWVEFSEGLPAAALGETIRLEFQFTGDPGTGQFFPGWYLDDVMVEAE